MADQTTSVEPAAPVAGAPKYDASYFRNYWGDGGPYERNERWLKFFGEVAEGIVRDLHPVSVLDAGCAMGFLVEALDERGVEAWGVDVSEYAISQVDESVRERCTVAALTDPLPRRYDLIACIEVIEHVPAADAERALANLCAASDRLLLSTTPGDFGEPTHLNVQPPEAWAAMLARQGFVRDLDQDFSFVSPWASLYTRVSEDQPGAVRRYDRAWSRLRQERAELRASLLDTQERLAKTEAEAEGRPELEAELARSNEEVLRLRNLLLTRDVELGEARGHVAVLEAHSRRLLGLAARVHARIPGASRIMSLLRWLKGLRS